MVNTWNNADANTYSQYDNSELRVIHPVILGLLGNVFGINIADYGCGEGKLLEELLNNGANVQGYDISSSMIQKSFERIGFRGKLEVIKTGQIPVSDTSLDAVVSNLVLMMCPTIREIRQIHEEVSRVLKPNGIFVYCITHPAFVDKVFTTYRNIFSERRDYFFEGQPYRFVLRKEDGTEVTNSSFIDHHYPISSYLNLLPETGFKLDKMVEVKLGGNECPPYLIVKATKTSNQKT